MQSSWQRASAPDSRPRVPRSCPSAGAWTLLATTALLAACGGGSGGSGSPPPDDTTLPLELATERAFPNLAAFDAPVLALQAPGDGSTWYVVEQAGRVWAFANDSGVSTRTVFLDIGARVKSGGEAGLLGMAFHPSYPSDPRVFINYTADVGGSLVSRVAQYRTTDGGRTLDPASETILFTVTQPASNHNGGNLAFADDGLLYVGFGDGGSSDDPWGAFGNGQNLLTLLGKIVRIDVDGVSGNVPYRVPAGNPYFGNAPCDHGTSTTQQECPEIYAYGFRNPWRWSFDRANGDLWVGDVGESALEEVDRVRSGGNYGWRCFEGTQTHSTDCGTNAASSLPPLAQYDHSAGIAITGGYVYRGAAVPALFGRYVFGDFGSGRIWHISSSTAPTRTLTAADSAADTALAVVSFAEAANGELYVLDYGGAMYRVVAR